MDLNVTYADGCGTGRAGPDLHDHSIGAWVNDLEVELIAARATIMVVDRAPNEGHWDDCLRVAGDTGNFTGAGEVNNADGNLRGFGCGPGATGNDDILSREMQARVVNHVPVTTTGSSRAAARIHDPTVGEIRRFARADIAATGHPTQPRRRRRGAERAAEHEFD